VWLLRGLKDVIPTRFTGSEEAVNDEETGKVVSISAGWSHTLAVTSECRKTTLYGGTTLTVWMFR
jgi:hypothetical protein